GQRLHAVLSDPLAGLAIAHAQRASGLPVEQGVVGPKIQFRFVEQQAHWNAAQLVVLALAQLVIEWVQQPAVLALYLGGDGELVILLRQALAVLLDDLADGDASEHRRCDSQTFEHDGSPENEKKASHAALTAWTGQGEGGVMETRSE